MFELMGNRHNNTATKKKIARSEMIERGYRETRRKAGKMPYNNLHAIDQKIIMLEAFVKRHSDNKSNKRVQNALERIKNLKSVKSCY